MRVLIIEDEHKIANSIKRGLEQESYAVDVVYDGEQGFDLASDDKSITVKLQDGSSKIILITDKTVINKAAEATKDDLKGGEKVAVFGEINSDGSVTAQNIQLNPILRAGQGPNSN